MSSDTNLLVFDQIDYVFIRQWYLCLFSSFSCSFLFSFLQACNVNLASFFYLFRSINMTRYLMSWLEQKYKYSVYTRLWTMMKDKAWLICSSQQDELNRKGTNWVHLSCTHTYIPLFSFSLFIPYLQSLLSHSKGLGRVAYLAFPQSKTLLGDFW